MLLGLMDSCHIPIGHIRERLSLGYLSTLKRQAFVSAFFFYRGSAHETERANQKRLISRS